MLHFLPSRTHPIAGLDEGSQKTLRTEVPPQRSAQIHFPLHHFGVDQVGHVDDFVRLFNRVLKARLGIKRN